MDRHRSSRTPRASGSPRRATPAFAAAVALITGVLAAVTSAIVAPSPASANAYATVSAGGTHTCALTTGGGVFCWGKNLNGQLGNGTTTDSAVPMPVTGLSSGVTAVVTGSDMSCAIVAGAAKCWGFNGNGQIGDGTTTNRLTPTQVSGLTAGVTAIGADVHVCAIVSGSARCWGANSVGQLGNGTTTQSLVPVQVTGLTSGVTSISAGNGQSCAVVSGSARCWGNGGSGRLGNSATANSSVPVQVSGLTSGVGSIRTGFDNTCALLLTGAVQCWGDNATGDLGDGNQGVDSSVPVQVSGLTSGVQAMSVGYSSACAVRSGEARCWGANSLGQLGIGSTVNQAVPAQVSGLASGVGFLDSGAQHSCVAVGVKLKCWGGNTNGRLGNNSTTNSNVPVNVFDPPDGAVHYAGADLLSTTSLRVRWTATTANESGFLVYRTDVTTGITTQTACPVATVDLTSCDDTGLTPGTYYAYSVFAWNTDGSINPGTSLITRTPSLAPADPTVLVAAATGAHTARVGWTDNSSDEAGFKVYRLSGASYVLLATTPPNTVAAAVVDATMDTAQLQVFLVSAFNAGGESFGDTFVYTQVNTGPAGPVASPTWALPAVNPTAVTVRWNDVATDERGYLLYRVAPNGTATQVPGCSVATPNLTQCTDTGLTPGTFYEYQVYAWNDSGTGTPGTPTVVHTPKPLAAPTITDAYGDGTNNIFMHWTDNATDETAYRAYRYIPATGALNLITTFGPNVTSLHLTGLPANQQLVLLVSTVRGTEERFAAYGIWANSAPAAGAAVGDVPAVADPDPGAPPPEAPAGGDGAPPAVVVADPAPAAG